MQIFNSQSRTKALMISVLSLAFMVVASGAYAALTFTNDDVTSDEDFTITGVEASTLTVTSASDAEDLTISVTGATDSSLHLSSSGTAADALTLTATAGGIDIAASGAAAGEDIDVTATGSSINLTSTESAADSTKLTSSAGGIDILATGAAAGEDIDVTATGSSVNISATENAADSVTITSTVGGIDIAASGAAAGEDIDITATGSSINLSATENAAAAITLTANGGTSETIVVTNTQGTGADAITLTSTAGGITITASSFIQIGSATGGLQYFAETETMTADDTLTIAESGKTFYIGTAGVDLTLPTVATANGVHYRFVVSAAFATTDVTVITGGSANVIEGTLVVAGAVVDCRAEDTISFINDGEQLGDFFELYSNGTNWFIGDSGSLTAAKMTCTQAS